MRNKLKHAKVDADAIKHADDNGIGQQILSRWNPQLAAADDTEETITMYEVIGYDWWTGGGVTAKRVAAALRAIGKNPVTVSINSPGGDFFEGTAIYNLLAEHPAKVTVKVAGLAASAASLIAMAGDEIQISQAGFFMIHDAWGVMVGNRHEFQKAADDFAKFDQAAVDVYAARSGLDAETVAEMMDAETWIPGSEAVDLGLADRIMSAKILNDEEDDEAKASAVARRTIENALARSGFTRQQREEIFGKAVSKRDAAAAGERDAAVEKAAQELMASLRS